MIYRLLWVQIVVYLFLFVFNGLPDKVIHSDDAKKAETIKEGSACGASKPKAHSMCKVPTLKEEQKNKYDSNTAALKQCVPFVPSCPCAQGMSKEPICSAKLDLGFIVPVSSRKRRQPFVDVELSRFIRHVVSRFHVSPKQTEVSVITYGVTPKMAFSFNRFSCQRQVLCRLQTLTQVCPRGQPRIGRALTFADYHMFKRPSRKAKVVVLLTNQRSCDDVKIPAKKLRSQNVRLISLGIGRYMDGAQMDDISSKPVSNNAFTADPNYLDFVTERLVRTICLGSGGFLEKTNSSCLCRQKHSKINKDYNLNC